MRFNMLLRLNFHSRILMRCSNHAAKPTRAASCHIPSSPMLSDRIRRIEKSVAAVAILIVAATTSSGLTADEPTVAGNTAAKSIVETPVIAIEMNGPGWTTLGEADFVRVNGDDDTMTWDGTKVLCSGSPIGVTRTKKQYKNFELLIQWRHLKSAGNSGVFAWTPPSALEDLPPNKLPSGGMEIQMLDHGYTERYKNRTGKEPDWFSTNGDVFAVGKSKFTPFPPLSPNGARSFPTEKRSNGFGQWNQYYVRGINGEIRLWVNGAEVSGGKDCQPAEGYLCLEHEGSPIEFRSIQVRELP